MFSLALHQSLYLYIYIECLILFICSCFYFYEVNSAYPFWGLFAVVLSHNLRNHPLLWASCIKTVNLDIKMSISVYFSLLPPCSNCLNEQFSLFGNIQITALVIANTPFQQHKRRLYISSGHHQMVNTEIRLIMFFEAKDGEDLYSQQKQDQELTVAQIMNFLLPNSDLN